MLSCDECGSVISDVHNLQKHVQTWCPAGLKRKAEINDEEPESKIKRPDWITPDDDSNDNSEIDYTEDISEHFETLAGEASRKTESIWEEKFEDFKTQGLIEKKARAKAFEFVFEDDKKEFLKLYSSFLQTAVQLDGSYVHKKLLREVIDSDISNVNRAVKRVLNKYSHWFDDLICNSEENNDSETSDEDE